MEAAQLEVEVDGTEPELRTREPPRWQLLPKTLVGWLVGLTLMLCVAGLAVQGSAMSEQLQLFRSHPASQLRASTANPLATEGALFVSSAAGSAQEFGDGNSSMATSKEAKVAGLSVASALNGDSSESTSAEADTLTTESHANSSSRSTSSRSDTVSSTDASASSQASTDNTSQESLRSRSMGADDSSRTQDGQSPAAQPSEVREKKDEDEQARPPSAALLLPGYKTVEQDETLPPRVHALWIGDPSRIAQGLKRYGQMGFEMTIHNSVDGILDGFAPHVRRAYELAIPRVVGFDFLKLLLLYKHGGLVVDADTYPLVFASQVTYSSECHVLFGKETHLDPWQFSTPTYRKIGGNTYGLARPYQLLNWAMLAREPRNPHAAALIDGAMRHFYGLRDMEQSLVQDVAGSGLMSDYVALLHAQHGLDYVAAFNDPVPAARLSAVDGLCMLEYELREGWIHHDFMNTWRQPE